MIVVSMMRDTVTVLRPGAPTRDAYGSDIPGADTETDVTGCLVLAPAAHLASGAEDTNARDQVVLSRLLFAPPNTDIRATDRIRHDGTTYEVRGTPATYPGRLAHVQASLREVTG